MVNSNFSSLFIFCFFTFSYNADPCAWDLWLSLILPWQGKYDWNTECAQNRKNWGGGSSTFKPCQLEANLSSLGFRPKGYIIVDHKVYNALLVNNMCAYVVYEVTEDTIKDFNIYNYTTITSEILTAHMADQIESLKVMKCRSFSWYIYKFFKQHIDVKRKM